MRHSRSRKHQYRFRVTLVPLVICEMRHPMVFGAQ